MKFNIACNTLKLNISERKTGLLLKFFNVDQIRIDVITEAMQPDNYKKDRVKELLKIATLKKMQERICLSDTFKYRKHKMLNGFEETQKKK